MASLATRQQLEAIATSNAWVDSDELIVTVGRLRELLENYSQDDGAYDEGYEDGIREAVRRVEWG